MDFLRKIVIFRTEFRILLIHTKIPLERKLKLTLAIEFAQVLPEPPYRRKFSLKEILTVFIENYIRNLAYYIL